MSCFFFFQAEDGIRDLVRSRGLGDVYKRQDRHRAAVAALAREPLAVVGDVGQEGPHHRAHQVLRDAEHEEACLLYTSDAADERSSVDLGGRRIIKKKNIKNLELQSNSTNNKKYTIYHVVVIVQMSTEIHNI